MADSESKSGRRINRGARKVTARELLADKARVDAAMEQIEAAKQKAKAQRAEYAKYLSWKVELQRQERKARDLEDGALRERIEDKLRSILKDHRLQVKAERDRWNAFRQAKPPARSPLRLANGLEKERQYIESVIAQRRAHIDQSTSAFRASLHPHTAPSGGSFSQRTRKLSPESPRADGHPPEAQLGHSTDSGAKAAAERIMDRSRTQGELDMPAIASMMLLPPIASTRAPMLEGSLTDEQVAKSVFGSPEGRRRHLAAIHAQHRLTLVTDMFEKARTRRLYATGRMLADPPADYVLGSDILRYIPADVLEEAKQPLSPRKPKAPPTTTAGDTVFLTQDQQLLTSSAAAGDSLPVPDPSQQHRQGISDPAASGKRMRWKKWDPDAWMKLPEPGSIKVIERRQPEEEHATLEWYRSYHEQYTKVKKRTEATRQYTWHPCAKHVLPPLGSNRFDEL